MPLAPRLVAVTTFSSLPYDEVFGRSAGGATPLVSKVSVGITSRSGHLGFNGEQRQRNTTARSAR